MENERKNRSFSKFVSDRSTDVGSKPCVIGGSPPTTRFENSIGSIETCSMISIVGKGRIDRSSCRVWGDRSDAGFVENKLARLLGSKADGMRYAMRARANGSSRKTNDSKQISRFRIERIQGSLHIRSTKRFAYAIGNDSKIQEKGSCKVWEMDFCSRPILDERKKKVWELLICTPDRSFVHAEYFPNNKINSTQLRDALRRVIEESGEKPDKIRFFRSQMQTIISKALQDLEVKPVPSKRCVTLMNLIEERLEEVYKKESGYDASIPPLLNLDGTSPDELPDALRGERWAFVQLDVAALKNEIEDVIQGKSFGEVYDLDALGMGDLPDNALVPGVAVFTARAAPLAAWTNGLDLGCLKAEPRYNSLVLETGINNRWKYGAITRAPGGEEEAEAWEAAKKEIKGLHFLAVQTDPDAETCAGFWLLQDRDPPKL